MSEFPVPPESTTTTTPPATDDGAPQTPVDDSSRPLDESFHEPSGGFKALRNAWNKKATGQETRMGSNRSHIGSYAYKKDRGDALRKSIHKTTSQHGGKSLDGSSHHVKKSLDNSAHSKQQLKPPHSRTTPIETVPSVVLEEKSTATGGATPELKALPLTEEKEPAPAVTSTTSTATATASPPKASVKNRWPPTKEVAEAKPPLASTTPYKSKPPVTTAPASAQEPLSPSTPPVPKTTDQASDRRMAYRMPQNVYQKPLAAKPEYKPPKFDRTEEELLVIRAALKKNFVFSDLETRDLLPLMNAFEKVQYGPEETIITQGAPGDYFYIIYDGRVSFQVNGVQVGKAGKGNSFGELALLYTCPRAASVMAYKASTTLFRVDQMTFRYILQNQTKQSEKAKRDLLQGVDFFRELSSFDLEKLSKVMTPRVFGPNDLIVTKGELGDAFYVIQEGEILIKDISVGSTVYEDQKLGPGGYFGERSLMTSEPRAANCMALTHGVAFSIDRATFEKILGKISALILRAQDSRQLSGVTLLQKANLSMKQFIALAQALRAVSFKAGKPVFRKRGFVFPALYLVRQGKVQITYADGRTEEILPGGYFGQELLELGAKKRMLRILAPFGATCPEDTILAELRIVDCRVVFPVEVLISEVDGAGAVVEEVDAEVVEEVEKEEEPQVEGEADLPQCAVEKMQELSLEFTPPSRPEVKLDDLKKITLLGAGTFGQVWLVSDKSNTEENTAYALKVQAKNDLVVEGQVQAVIQERNIMSKIHHPFIVDFVASYMDKHFIYMVVNLIQGGELFSRIHDMDLEESGLPEHQAKFYALCIADALAYLHRQGYVFRDLKTENVMIDVQGYPKIIDFGFAKHITEKTFTLCGTPGYLPPEIVMTRGHDWSADHWSFGILIYDMITGNNPFYFEGMDQMTLFRSIVQDGYPEPEGASAEATGLIARLLEKEPGQRLGSLARGEQDILEHQWFSDLDLSALRKREVTAPWIPIVKDLMDTSCFDDWDHLVDKMVEKSPNLTEDEERLFADF